MPQSADRKLIFITYLSLCASFRCRNTLLFRYRTVTVITRDRHMYTMATQGLHNIQHHSLGGWDVMSKHDTPDDVNTYHMISCLIALNEGIFELGHPKPKAGLPLGQDHIHDTTGALFETWSADLEGSSPDV